MLVDEQTQLKFSDFFSSKNGMVEPTCQKLHAWRSNGMGVKQIRLDNAGENKSLIKRANGSNWKLNLEPEYTARNTPQHNHLAELAFASCYNHGRAMVHATNLDLKWQYKLFPYAFATALSLMGL